MTTSGKKYSALSGLSAWVRRKWGRRAAISPRKLGGKTPDIHGSRAVRRQLRPGLPIFRADDPPTVLLDSRVFLDSSR